jgi:hypothetical protein
MLNTELEQYELEIQNYEHLYEQQLATFRSEIYKSQSLDQINQINESMHSIETYLYHHIQLLLHQIRYKESCFHAKLLRSNPRYQIRKQRKTIDVYPQIIVDVSKVKLNRNQLVYLSHTGQ